MNLLAPRVPCRPARRYCLWIERKNVNGDDRSIFRNIPVWQQLPIRFLAALLICLFEVTACLAVTNVAFVGDSITSIRSYTDKFRDSLDRNTTCRTLALVARRC